VIDPHDTCWKCDGVGVLLVCIDDLCRGAGECMHGDGYAECGVCGGTGELPWCDEDDE
jgi:hypothetical protein